MCVQLTHWYYIGNFNIFGYKILCISKASHRWSWLITLAIRPLTIKFLFSSNIQLFSKSDLFSPNPGPLHVPTRKPKMMKSLASLGIRCPILKANHLHRNRRRPRDRLEATEEDSASDADDQQTPPSVTVKRRAQGMLMYFCLFLLYFQTNKSIATARGPPGKPEVCMTTVMDAAYSRSYYACPGITPDILHRFTPIIFFTLREAVLDAKNYSQQGHNQVLQQGHYQVHARVSNPALIDKYEKTSTSTTPKYVQYILLPVRCSPHIAPTPLHSAPTQP